MRREGSATSRQALTGLRILDLSQFEAGPAATQLLAWLGADVLKVERPAVGEQGRQARRHADGRDGLRWMLLNSSKRSLTLNLKSTAGKEVLTRLITQSDVLVENFGPGAMERLGFAPDAVASLNPSLVYGRVKGYGAGRFESSLSVDAVAQATSGLLSVTGDPSGVPLRPGANVADATTALHLTVGILAALYQRRDTGLGQVVEVNLEDSLVNLCRVIYSEALESGTATGRKGNDNPQSAPSGLYRCAPGGPNDYCLVYTIVGEAGNRQWHAILRAIGRPDLVGDPWYATAAARVSRRSEVDDLVTAWTRTKTKHEVMSILSAMGVPAGAVNDTVDVINDPDLERRGTFIGVEHPTQGRIRIPGMPISMSASPPLINAAPLLGQNTEEILKTLLQLSEADVDRLSRHGDI